MGVSYMYKRLKRLYAFQLFISFLILIIYESAAKLATCWLMKPL